MSTFNSKDLIWIKDNSLNSDDCKFIINQFEEDKRKHPGETIGGLDQKTKRTTDLRITGLQGWEEVDSLIYKSFNQSLREYLGYLKSLNSKIDPFAGYSAKSANDGGYHIQRYDAGDSPGYYDWHSDNYLGQEGLRIMTFLWYLNDVTEGGETEFVDGIKIQPKSGRLVIFPATWTYLHRGLLPVSNPKWITISWLYVK